MQRGKESCTRTPSRTASPQSRPPFSACRGVRQYGPILSGMNRRPNPIRRLLDSKVLAAGGSFQKLIDVETTGTCDELCLSLRAGRLALKPGVVVRHVSPPQAYFETRGISRSGNYLADDDLLTQLIGRIYDAAMTPALWAATLPAFLPKTALARTARRSITSGFIPSKCRSIQKPIRGWTPSQTCVLSTSDRWSASRTLSRRTNFIRDVSSASGWNLRVGSTPPTAFLKRLSRIARF